MDIANALKLARRAKEDNDSEGAKKYYELVLLEDPDNWEANFYGAYFTAQSTTLQNIPSTASTFANKLKSALRLVKESIEDSLELKTTVTEMSAKVLGTAVFYRDNAINYRNKFTDVGTSGSWIKCALELVVTFADNVEELFPDNEDLIKIAVGDWKAAFDSINNDRFLYFSGMDTFKKSLKEKVRKYEPDFRVKEDEEAAQRAKEAEEKKKASQNSSKSSTGSKPAISCGSALLTMLFGR